MTNARWQTQTCVNFHDGNGKSFSKFKLNPGDDAGQVRFEGLTRSVARRSRCSAVRWSPAQAARRCRLLLPQILVHCALLAFPPRSTPLPAHTPHIRLSGQSLPLECLCMQHIRNSWKLSRQCTVSWISLIYNKQSPDVRAHISIVAERQEKGGRDAIGKSRGQVFTCEVNEEKKTRTGVGGKV